MKAEQYISPAVKHELSLCNHWKEITESKYKDALGIMPPLKWNNGGFFLDGSICGFVYCFFQEWYGKYYTSLQMVTMPRQKIIDSLMEYISKEGAV